MVTEPDLWDFLFLPSIPEADGIFLWPPGHEAWRACTGGAEPTSGPANHTRSHSGHLATQYVLDLRCLQVLPPKCFWNDVMKGTLLTVNLVIKRTYPLLHGEMI